MVTRRSRIPRDAPVRQSRWNVGDERVRAGRRRLRQAARTRARGPAARAVTAPGEARPPRRRPRSRARRALQGPSQADAQARAGDAEGRHESAAARRAAAGRRVARAGEASSRRGSRTSRGPESPRPPRRQRPASASRAARSKHAGRVRRASDGRAPRIRRLGCSRLLAPGLSGEHHRPLGDGRLQPGARPVPFALLVLFVFGKVLQSRDVEDERHPRPPGALPRRRAGLAANASTGSATARRRSASSPRSARSGSGPRSGARWTPPSAASTTSSAAAGSSRSASRW